MSQSADRSMADKVGPNLPYLRRYARALTGSQGRGDAYAAATLEAILADPSLFADTATPRVALFAAFHSIWVSSGASLDSDNDSLAQKAQAHLAGLTEGTREVLLLRTLEEFSTDDVAKITGSGGVLHCR